MIGPHCGNQVREYKLGNLSKHRKVMPNTFKPYQPSPKFLPSPKSNISNNNIRDHPFNTSANFQDF